MRYLLLLLLSTSLRTLAQTGRDPKYFPKTDKVLPAGVVYHAQLFPEKEWERDFAKIAQLGFTFVRLGEDAWPRLEPAEGKFDLLWLDRCIDLAARFKLKVILSTSTSAPPAWLFRLHPEFEARDEGGSNSYLGDRFYGSSASTAYRQYADRLTTALSKRYGQNAAIIGWLVDRPTTYDYSPVAITAFQVYMRERAKGNLDTLNARWGTANTPLHYYSWEDIQLPVRYNLNITKRTYQDFERFSAVKAAEQVNSQVEALRRNTVGQFITCSYSLHRRLGASDPFLFKGQDFVSTSAYSVPDSEREDDFNHDVAESVNGRTGQNALDLTPSPFSFESGWLRLAIWQQYGLGVDYLCFTPYRLRDSNHAIVSANGQQLTRLGDEILQTLTTVERLKGNRMTEAVQPLALNRLRTAILFQQDAPSPHSLMRERHSQLSSYHKAVAVGAPVTFLHPGQPIDKTIHPLVIVPAARSATTAEMASWRAYLRTGGRILLYAGALNTDYNQAASYPFSLSSLLLADPAALGLDDGLTLQPNAADSAEAFPAHSSPVYAVRRKIYPGTLLYVSSYDPSLFTQALNSLYAEATAPSADLPSGVYARWHEGLLIVTNFSPTPFQAAFPSAERIVGTGPSIAPGEVGVFKMYK